MEVSHFLAHHIRVEAQRRAGPLIGVGRETGRMDDALTWSEVRDLVDVGRSDDVSGLIDRLVEYRDRVGDRWEMDPAR